MTNGEQMGFPNTFDILDKIRAEIEKTKTTMNMFNREDTKQYAIAMEDVLNIIDKYKEIN